MWQKWREGKVREGKERIERERITFVYFILTKIKTNQPKPYNHHHNNNKTTKPNKPLNNHHNKLCFQVIRSEMIAVTQRKSLNTAEGSREKSLCNERTEGGLLKFSGSKLEDRHGWRVESWVKGSCEKWTRDNWEQVLLRNVEKF